ncbi:unnamed protein product [Arabis nemorensis]|uniref:Zinc knuckle CX2CX4HX4C domain-containing protein n=1 Tax=Arabis nemorensis TaxID=586526 RepID=A0A565BIL7_9BRAS|nr:unnamed protein product [Arabis nemorensis]
MSDSLHTALEDDEPINLPDNPKFKVMDSAERSSSTQIVRIVFSSSSNVRKIYSRFSNTSHGHTALGTLDSRSPPPKAICKVEEIAYDPKSSHKTEYVRSLITFDIANPARNTKTLNIKGERPVEIEYEYEKIHKKCFYCLRLTQEKSSCPLLRKPQSFLKLLQQPTNAVERSSLEVAALTQPIQALEGPPGFPPMFPHLSRQDQRMALQYVSHADETERRARICRVQQSMEETVGDSSTHLTKITHDLNKGKGHVFQYPEDTTYCLLGEAFITSDHAYKGHREVGEEVSSTQSLNSWHPKESTVFQPGLLVRFLYPAFLRLLEEVDADRLHGNVNPGLLCKDLKLHSLY